MIVINLHPNRLLCNKSAETAKYTNIGYRIANFLHIMKGSNDLGFLSRYSKHIILQSDNMKNLRGAFGPRVRNWIGAHQLQDMINTNADVDQAENYVKPVGIDQTMSVFDDLRNGMQASTMVIRDPGIDFDETEDVPDLTAVTFSIADIGIHKSVCCAMLYQSIDSKNLVNEIWAMSMIAQIYESLLDDITDSELTIVSCCGQDSFGTGLDFLDKDSTLLSLHDTITTDEEVHIFWQELELLQKFATHIQFYLNESTFNNPLVSTEICHRALSSVFSSKIQNRILKDMAYALTIWAFNEYGVLSDGDHTAAYEEQVLSLMKSMSEYIELSGGIDSNISAELKQYMNSSSSMMYAISQLCQVQHVKV